MERNIYRRPTGVLEVGFKDASGIQRWRTVDGGIMAARKLRDDLLARRGRGRRSRRTLGFGSERPPTSGWPDRCSTCARRRRPATAARLSSTSRRASETAGSTASLLTTWRRWSARCGEQGKSEATIAAVLGAVGRIYKFAARRLGFTGMNPITLMLSSERPKVSQATRWPIFTPEQIEQTLAAATEPYRTLFTVAALTGARMSELCGLTWANVRLDDLDDAEITFAWQVDRKGNRRPTKTDGSARTVPIPRELALVLVRHKLASRATRA